MDVQELGDVTEVLLYCNWGIESGVWLPVCTWGVSFFRCTESFCSLCADRTRISPIRGFPAPDRNYQEPRLEASSADSHIPKCRIGRGQLELRSLPQSLLNLRSRRPTSVLQVIFGRDMDFSGEGDGTDLAAPASEVPPVCHYFEACAEEYDGRAGLSSQSVPRAGRQASDTQA